MLIRHLFNVFLLVCCGLVAPVAQAANPEACPAILNHKFSRLQDDAPQNLCQYAGKAVLVVNTASYCGFTSQYEGLEKLYQRYQNSGLVVLGFPSNNFGQQEPGSAKQIADFCFNTYGVKFPMLSKTEVVGPEQHPFFSALSKASGSAPKWNFHKYLIDRNGKVVASFSSMVAPTSPDLIKAVDKALAGPVAR